MEGETGREEGSEGGVSIIGLLAADAPPTWIDRTGRVWRTPTIIGRLKFRIPGHAALRAHVVQRDGSCRHCGATEDLIADHVVSRRNGGAHHPDNLQALCQSCNSRKVGMVDSRSRP